MLRKIVAIAVLLAFTWQPLALAMPAPQQPPAKLTYEQAVARLDRFMKLIEELRSHIDRSQFDLDALIEKLDYDPETIIHFVTDEIAFEQYPGLLRGAKGTLMSRAGNALDQAVLLATLLKNAGADARILRGTLSPADARQLLDRMFLPRPPRPAIGDQQAIDAVMAKVTGAVVSKQTASKDLADSINEMQTGREASYRTAQQTGEDFQRRLKAAGIALGDPDMPRKLTAEAQDYFWVEYRLGAAGPWEAAHPAFGTDQAPAVQRSQTVEDSVPQELQQRVRFEVEIEQQTNGRLTRKKVMSGWERPAANLIGLQMRYANVPSGLSPEAGFQNPDEMARKTEFFAPVFNGQLAPHAQLFDLDGVTAPPIVGTSPALGVVKQVGQKAAAATEALSALGAKQGATKRPVRSLTGAWFVYTLITSGGREKPVRRTLYDAIGDEQRRAGFLTDSLIEPDRTEVTLNLARGVTFMVSPCDYPPAYIVDRVLSQLVGLRQVWEAGLRARYGRNDSTSVEAALNAATTSPEFALFPAIAGGVPTDRDLVSYEAEPTIVSTWSEARLSQGRASIRSAVDVVAQGRRILRMAPVGPLPAVGAAMMAGVWTTEAEQLVPLPANLPEAGHVGALHMLEDARRARVQLRAIAPNDILAADQLALPAIVKSSMKKALSEGYAVIAPERLSEEISPGWWRVAPQSGQTLGMGPQGRGTEITEYLKQFMIAAAIAFVLSRVEYHLCISKGCEKAECTKAATHSLWMGVFIGATVALAGAVVFVAAPALPGVALAVSALDLSEASTLELYRIISELTKILREGGEIIEGVHSFVEQVVHPTEAYKVVAEGLYGECEER